MCCCVFRVIIKENNLLVVIRSRQGSLSTGTKVSSILTAWNNEKPFELGLTVWFYIKRALPCSVKDGESLIVFENGRDWKGVKDQQLKKGQENIYDGLQNLRVL